MFNSVCKFQFDMFQQYAMCLHFCVRRARGTRFFSWPQHWQETFPRTDPRKPASALVKMSGCSALAPRTSVKILYWILQKGTSVENMWKPLNTKLFIMELYCMDLFMSLKACCFHHRDDMFGTTVFCVYKKCLNCTAPHIYCINILCNIM